jgi:5-methylcytosine-specific restriction endonuclease McrA
MRGINITRLLARDGSNCGICGLPLDRSIDDPNDDNFVTFDHITPSSVGGTDRLDNLRLAHLRCNQLRADGP